MSSPLDPTVEFRLSALEQAVAAMQQGFAALLQDRDALSNRLTTLEETASRGLADLERAMADLQLRRPPVRRELAELKERLEADTPPADPGAGEQEVTP